MIIEKQLLEVWKKRFKNVPKDVAAAEIGITKQCLYNTLRTGKCWPKTMRLINLWLINNKDRELTKIDKINA